MSENTEMEKKTRTITYKISFSIIIVVLLLALSVLMGLIIHENTILKSKVSSLEVSSSLSMDELKQSLGSLEKALIERAEGKSLLPRATETPSSMEVSLLDSIPGNPGTTEDADSYGKASSLKALTMALSGDYGFDETEALFINSMNTDPDCLEAFYSYWAWVEENCFDSNRVTFFLSLIESSMYKCSPENVPHLAILFSKVYDSIYEMENKKASSLTTEVSTVDVVSLYEASDFEGFRVSFAAYLEKIEDYAEESESAKEFMNKYEPAFVAVSRYKLIVEQDGLLMSLPDSVFLSAYPASFSEYLSNLQEIANMKEQDSLAEQVFLKAEVIAQKWDNRYNNILVTKVEDDYLAVKNGKESAKEKYNTLSIIYSAEFATLYTLNIIDSNLSGKILILGQAISNLLTDLQRTMYTDYQIGTARLIKKIKNEISSVDKKDKLKFLYEAGYFNINRDYLFSELRDIYEGILDKSYVKNSSLSEAELQISYPIVQLELGDL